MKYYHHHFLIALAIDLVMYFLTGSFFCGFFFYAGREIAQYEEKNYWDHKGWLWPLGGSLAFYTIIIIFKL